MIRHAEDRTGAELEWGLIDHVEDAGEPFVRRSSFLDLQRTEPAVAFKDRVDLLGIAVAVMLT